MGVLARINISTVDDSWVWNLGLEDGILVKSTYVFLDHFLRTHDPISSLPSFAFKFIWKSGVPSKISAFSWQLLLDKIPTHDNLRRRGVLFCQEEVEMMCHLFLHCIFASDIWYAINRWYGVCSVIPPTVPMSYAVLVGCGSNKKRRKGMLVVWLVLMWAV
jgi:hypothetical protein